MPLNVVTQAYVMVGEDPKKEIVERIEPYLDDVQIGGRDVLVAVYKPSKDARTKGGLLLPDRVRDESDFQGVTGLVVKLGPLAYQTDASRAWFADKDGEPDPPKIGDWVLFDTKDTHSFIIGTQTCRLVGDQYVRAKVRRPDIAV